MNPLIDRSAPGVRIVVLPNEKADQGEPLDLGDRIIGFTFEDAERKADKVAIQLDNFDLAMFEHEHLVGGATLEVSWGYRVIWPFRDAWCSRSSRASQR